MDLKISKVNEVFMQIACDDSIAKDLHDFFSFKVPNAKFMPSYKNRRWDGKVYLFSIKKHKIYIGLLPYIAAFCEERKYKYEVESDVVVKNVITEDELLKFIEDLDLPFEPRDYQLEAFKRSIEYGRKLLVSPTASGKSLIIYLLSRFYDKKTVIIVPTTSLVEQMSKDFAEYGYKEPICKIYSGQPVFDAPVTITTWQSLSKAPTDVLLSFDVVVGDEAHLFKANVLKGILEKMKSTSVRFGTTGTLDGTEVHRLQLEGLFGPATKVISTSDLIEDGTIASIEIDVIILEHEKQKKISYQDEMEYLVSNKKRNDFLCNLVYSLKGNTLVLFQFVEKHGFVLHGKMKDRVKDLHYVYGGTDTKDREEIRELVETQDDAVILASYGTFSTGVNIKKIDNIVFASPSKSRIRNLQSIGRGLRKGNGKESLRLFDIADDLWGDNYTLRHLKERINIYNEENFPYNIRQFKL